MKAVSQVVAALLLAAAAGVLGAIFASIFLPYLPSIAPYNPSAEAHIVRVAYTGNLLILDVEVNLYAPAHGNIRLSTARGSIVIGGSRYDLSPAVGCGSPINEICSGSLPSSTQRIPIILRSSAQIQPNSEGTLILVFRYGGGEFYASATFKT
mgnify:CR=1 FL=1